MTIGFENSASLSFAFPIAIHRTAIAILTTYNFIPIRILLFLQFSRILYFCFVRCCSRKFLLNLAALNRMTGISTIQRVGTSFIGHVDLKDGSAYARFIRSLLLHEISENVRSIYAIITLG